MVGIPATQWAKNRAVKSRFYEDFIQSETSLDSEGEWPRMRIAIAGNNAYQTVRLLYAHPSTARISFNGREG